MSAEIVGIDISERAKAAPKAASPTGRDRPLILALPKGRLLGTVRPLLAAAGIEPDPDLFDESSRKLQFETNDPGLAIIRVRSFDTATFLAYGAADLAVAGSDVLLEFDHPGIVAPVDLDIAHCRLSVAEPVDLAGQSDPRIWSHVRVATKYPNLAGRHFAARGVQAECIKLNGAMELAPKLGLSPHIVDLVQTGRTLTENGLVEVERIIDVSARLAVNRAALRARSRLLGGWIGRFQEVLRAA